VWIEAFVLTAVLAQSDAEQAFLRDKILGMLVGSAIGDAMGAPTEMWTRTQIEAEYGYVRDLHPRMTPPSPEGTWELNVRAGTTTDDTRWKALTVDYLSETNGSELRAKDLAAHLSGRFASEIDELRKLTIDDPAPALIAGVMRLQWLKEWERVARAYMGGDLDEYSSALNRFYGGEMVCAGLLFSPTLGSSTSDARSSSSSTTAATTTPPPRSPARCWALISARTHCPRVGFKRRSSETGPSASTSKFWPSASWPRSNAAARVFLRRGRRA